MKQRFAQHIMKLQKARRTINSHSRYRAEIIHIENAVVRLPVRSDNAGAVDRKYRMQLHQRNIVQQHIVTALQKTGIDGKHRKQTLRGEAGRHGRTCSFGDSDIKKALREGVCKVFQAGSVSHGGSNGHDLIVLGRVFAQSIAESIGKTTFLAEDLAGDGVELPDAMEDIRVLLRIGIALPLGGQHMEEDCLVGIARPAQGRLERMNIVAIHRAKITQPHLTENVVRQQQ